MTIIYVSGIDGCGKTTQSQLLVDWLSRRGHSAEYQWLRWEPSILPLIRKFKPQGSSADAPVMASQGNVRQQENQSHSRWRKLKGQLMSSRLFRALWMNYATRDYQAAYSRVKDSWTSDFIVMDRYLMDFVVDQSINFGISPEQFLTRAQTSAIARMAQPEYSIFIAIPAELGYERKMDGTPLQYLKEREALYSGMQLTNTLHVDGQQSVEAIHQDITNWLDSKLELNNA